MNRIILLLLAVVMVTTSSVAQEKTKVTTMKISGTVSDTKTGEKLPFVNVGLMSERDTIFVRGTATNLEGHFEITDIKPGKYLLQASCVGYGNCTKSINITHSISDIEIKIESGTTLKMVEITAKRPLYVMDGEKNMYNTKEDPSIQTGTASDALQNAPGVEVDAEGNITLRGVSDVEIWINDRPSHMNEEAIKQYIKQLPANAIERIEVITNPSARYSTNGGVINIVTNQTITRNELFCFGLSASTAPVFVPWISYVWANEKIDINLYLNANYYTQRFGSDGTSTLLDNNGDTSRTQRYSNENESPTIGGYMGFNMNWKIDDMTNLSAWMGIYPGWNHNQQESDYTYFEYQQSAPLNLSYNDTTTDRRFWIGGYAGAWLEHRFDTTGHKLSITFNGNLWNSHIRGDQWRQYTMATALNFDRRTKAYSMGPTINLGINYTLPLQNGIELESGAEIQFNYNTNDSELDSLNGSGNWDYIKHRYVYAKGGSIEPQIYITAQKRWGGFTTKIGLRGESQFDYASLQHKDEKTMTVDTTFFSLVPSIHLSYQTQNYTSYSISYTLRTSTPLKLQDLSPFRIYSDYSFSTGNPNLLRTYTHNIEAAFNKFLVGFGNIGINAYLRINNDEQGTAIGSTVDPIISPYLVNYTLPVNIGSSHTEGIEANITYRPTAFLNVRLNASLFNYGFDYNGYNDQKVSYTLRLNVWTKLWQKLEIFANAHYSSPQLGLYSLSVVNKGIDLGLSSDFFNRKLSVYLNVNDVFGMTEWGENTTAPNYQTTGSQHYNSRFVCIGLTWRIGKMELENKARQGANDNNPSMQQQ